MIDHRCSAWRLDELTNWWVCFDCGSPEAPRWDTPLRGSKGQVTRDPDGVLYLEVQVGADWWAVPVPEPMAVALGVAIKAAQ